MSGRSRMKDRVRSQVPSSPIITAPPMIEQQKSHRRSIADYSSFRPQAIACSSPTFIPDGQSLQNTEAQFDGDFSSLGAIAGDSGIALFRASRPDVPLLILSHSAMVGKGGISNLAFEPTMTSSVYLAAARGNGVLIWDASGHSLSPLLGRLAIKQTTTETYPGDIRSISWKPEQSQNLIATTSTTDTCIWDLRVSLGVRSSKPVARFGRVANSSPLNQVAFAFNDECATMDTDGEVRVFDVRMTGLSKPRLLGNFHAFQSAGVGLSSLRTANDESLWLTWGLDASAGADAVVKIWSLTKPKDIEKQTESSNYWHMDASRMERTPMKIPHTDSQKSNAVTKVAQFSMPSLMCARVCPQPFESSIVTVGLAAKSTPGKWKAELWKLSTDSDEASECTETFGVEKILSFEEDLQSFSKPYGDKLAKASLCGAELALCQTSSARNRTPTSDGSSSEWELVLCCMKEDGYLTTSLVSEVILGRDVPLDTRLDSNRLLRFFPNERRSNTTRDAATTFKISHDRGQSSLDDSVHGFLDVPRAPSSPEKSCRSIDDDTDRSTKGPTSLLTTQFDLDVAVPSSQEYGPFVTALPIASVSDNMEISQSRPSVGPEKVPCPRLCGATFSSGIGGLVCFNNGQVQKMWVWYQKNESRIKSRSERPSGDVQKNSVYPRSKKDLDDMTKAAIDARWGGVAENTDIEEANHDSESTIHDFFDLSSEDEGDADSVSEEEPPPSRLVIESEGDSNEDLFSGYHEGHAKLYEQPRSSPRAKAPAISLGETFNNLILSTQTRQHHIASFDGPSSDALAPIVLLLFDADGSIFQNQNAHLANNLVLGEWKTNEHKNCAGLLSLRTGATYSAVQEESSQVSPSARLPRLLASPVAQASLWKQGMVHVNSEPFFHPPGSHSTAQVSLAPRIVRDDETVHGGEYTLRQGDEDSAVLLRKVHHAPHQSSVLSQTEFVALPSKLESPIKRSASSNAILQSVRNNSRAREVTSQQRIGVTTLSAPPSDKINCLSDGAIKLKELCRTNENVCRSACQDSKANTWSLLCQTIDILVNDDVSGVDGWGGTSALGSEIVKNLVEYYEAQGDIQMVVTIACVLSTSPSSVKPLLPPSKNYDLVIQRYAEMVDRWGLLTKRVELQKHLSQQPSDSDLLLTSDTKDGEKGTGIDLCFYCPRCGRGTSSNTVCPKCHIFSFRCVLCDNSIRGLFTFCILCKHGGHLRHMVDWFEDNDVCPTGCGCKCVLTSASSNEMAPYQYDRRVAGDNDPMAFSLTQR